GTFPSPTPVRFRLPLTDRSACIQITYRLLCLFRGVPMRAVQQPRALATRERIIRAAARLFALKGYHDTKLDEILEAAHITTGAFFHHFGSKEELGFAVLDHHMANRRQQLEEIESRLPRSEEEDPLRQVFRRLDAIEEMVRCRQPRKGGCIIGNLSTELS